MHPVHRLARALSLFALLSASLLGTRPVLADDPPPAETPAPGNSGPQGGGTTPQIPPGCAYTFATNQNLTDFAILDNQVITSTLTLGGLGTHLWDANVMVQIDHTFNADLDIYLISPHGTRVTLTTDNGG